MGAWMRSDGWLCWDGGKVTLTFGCRKFEADSSFFLLSQPPQTNVQSRWIFPPSPLFLIAGLEAPRRLYEANLEMNPIYHLETTLGRWLF